MKELIKVEQKQIGNENVQAVSARELHKGLGVKDKFSDWTKRYINKFVENQDYIVFRVDPKNPQGGRPSIEYALTLDMAKHVAMMSDTARSMEVRQYFIKCEKQLRDYQSKWLKARAEGKLARRKETDVIQEFVEYATNQGSTNAGFYYTNITKGTYKALYMLDSANECRGLRERLSSMQLNQLATAEYVAQKYIAEHMDMGTHYKDIYRIAIAKVEELARILGKQLPGSNVKKLR